MTAVRQATAAVRRTADGDDAGMSLVEMLVALLVLGVILAAFASSLISFSKMSIVNERRVQASAFLGTLHEELQSLRWQDAGVYAHELAELSVLGADLSTDPPTLDGEPLVVIAEPDDARSERVPLTSGTRQVDGRTYEFFQAVTWDTSTPIEETVKRFTTLVRWTVGETTYEQRFESTRAGTPSEVEVRVAPEIRRFEVSPGAVDLDDADRNLSLIEIEVVFSRGITSAHVVMMAVDDDDASEWSLELDPLDHVDSRPFSFIGHMEALEGAFSAGDWSFTVIGLDGADEIVETRTVRFVTPCEGDECDLEEDEEADGDGEEVATPVIDESDIILSSYGPKVGAKHDDEGRFCEPLTVTVTVDDLVEDGVVTLSYLGDDTDTRVHMSASTTPITGERDVFTYTFEGHESPWRPTKDESISERFSITARNPSGDPSQTARSELVIFSTNNNEMC